MPLDNEISVVTRPEQNAERSKEYFHFINVYLPDDLGKFVVLKHGLLTSLPWKGAWLSRTWPKPQNSLPLRCSLAAEQLCFATDRICQDAELSVLCAQLSRARCHSSQQHCCSTYAKEAASRTSSYSHHVYCISQSLCFPGTLGNLLGEERN